MQHYLDVALRALTNRHAAEVIERITPGQLGCVDCGHIAEHAAFGQGKRSICPACGVDVRQSGFVDGNQVAELNQTQTAGISYR